MPKMQELMNSAIAKVFVMILAVRAREICDTKSSEENFNDFC
jgi:hypothetical protein